MSKSSEKDSSGAGRYQAVSKTAGGPHGVEALEKLDPQVLHSAVCEVLMAGDAILLGTTRDGGAVAMQLYSGDAVDKLYAATVEELQDTLSGVVRAASAR